MPGTFRELCDDFNKSARELPLGGKTSDVMLTRYALLLRHRAETEEQKAELVAALYTCGKELLVAFTGPKSGNWIGDAVPGNVRAVFEALREPESLRHLPQNAPRELSDIALDLIAKVDNAKESYFSSPNRYEGYVKWMTNFSQIALKTADAAQAEIEGRTVDIKTGKTITPARRLVLKQPDPPAS